MSLVIFEPSTVGRNGFEFTGSVDPAIVGFLVVMALVYHLGGLNVFAARADARRIDRRLKITLFAGSIPLSVSFLAILTMRILENL